MTFDKIFASLAISVPQCLSNLVFGQFLIIGYVWAIGMPIKLSGITFHVQREFTPLIGDGDEAVNGFLCNLTHRFRNGFPGKATRLGDVVGEVALRNSIFVVVGSQAVLAPVQRFPDTHGRR
ncbi:hypothetical protein D3C78_473840 [compost metagenome]